MNAMEVNDELLSAYLDGELEDTQRQQLDAALQADPGARLRLERLRHADQALQAALPLRSGDVTETALIATIRGQAPALPQPRRTLLPWALAASLAGVMLGYLLPRTDTDPQTTARTGMLEPQWQQVLDETPSGATGRDGLQVMLTFQAEDGQYCRLFRVRTAGSEGEGLACHDSTAWRLAAWDASGVAADPSAFRTAGPSALVDSAMSALGGTPAFDAQQEAQVISRGWREP